MWFFQNVVTSAALVKKWRGTSPPVMDLGLTTSPHEIIDHVTISVLQNERKIDRFFKNFTEDLRMLGAKSNGSGRRIEISVKILLQKR